MFTDKQKVLAEAEKVLNGPDKPWEVTIEGDKIIAKWKWLDATFFSPADINNQVKSFVFIVTLKDNGLWKEKCKTSERKINFDIRSGKITISNDTFIGLSTRTSYTAGLGVDNNTGKVGIVTSKFDTDRIKAAIRAYLASCGWKRKGF